MIERAGIEAKFGFKAHPHMLRHACGYKLANDGHDTRALQAYLGHKAHSPLHRDGPDAIQGLLVLIDAPTPLPPLSKSHLSRYIRRHAGTPVCTCRFHGAAKTGRLCLCEAGYIYSLPQAVAHAATKRGLVAKQQPPDWNPPSIFRPPKVLTEAEAELKAPTAGR